MLEKLAEWYLKRCGRVVPSRYFSGMIIGGPASSARCVGVSNGMSSWNVDIPQRAIELIALDSARIYSSYYMLDTR